MSEEEQICDDLFVATMERAKALPGEIDTLMLRMHKRYVGQTFKVEGLRGEIADWISRGVAYESKISAMQGEMFALRDSLSKSHAREEELRKGTRDLLCSSALAVAALTASATVFVLVLTGVIR